MEYLETEIDERSRARIGKLRWHCRRALLELDIVFQRFWSEVGDDLDDVTMNTLEALLEEEDHDLWELVSGRRHSEDPARQRLLERLRATRKINTFELERH